MAPVEGMPAKKQWDYIKWKKGWTKPKPPVQVLSPKAKEDPAFELTEVDGEAEIPETPYQI